MSAKWRRRLLITASAILAVILGGTTKGPAWLEGIYYDTALAAHALLQPDTLHEAGVLVVGLDEASLAHPDLTQRPRALLGPVWAQTLTALRTAGAKVVVFDFILAFSGEKIAPGYDRTFLRALYENRAHTVLGRSQDLLPARSYSAALGFGPMSLGLSEVMPDGDGVFRQVPLMLGGDKNVPALAGAALSLTGMTDFPNKVRLAPLQPVDSLPTLSVLQVLSCAKSDPGALTKAVNGKLVFIGTVLEEEDKKLSPSRFFAAGQQNEAPITSNVKATSDTQNCDPRRDGTGATSISGVYLHALAADQVLGQRVLSDLNIWITIL
ncbi:MAG: CHASE2 domain-containing protein, partial [Alphaproteobacteria bacterium]|nr:CHASE2 domain-containing protein [Alphaproteobacteria bacterium]